MYSSSKKFFAFLIWMTMIFASTMLLAQSPMYSVKTTSFSSSIYDEFSPHFVDGKLIYCSNLPTGSMRQFENDDGFIFNLFFAEKKNDGKWARPKLLAKELTTQLNDGPATFNDDMTEVFFSRNLYVEGKRKDITNEDNKIGLFSARYFNGSWIDSTAFPYNSVEYSLVSPSLSSDEKRIYFSSNMPGGHGGFDIYYCEMINGEWQKPINMGDKVNTSFDETHPFISNSEKLFFASEGHNGMGGKDIFYTQQIYGEWQIPVHLDLPINTEADDFGFFTNDDIQSGYFSSNRKGTDDIFQFERSDVSFDNCVEQRENKFCFAFYDENIVTSDTIYSIYEWDFGDNIKLVGEEVAHCFPGPGTYSVVLRVMDGHTGDTINTPYPYDIDLRKIEQAYINSSSKGFVGETLNFDGLQINLPDFIVKEYLWNFGEGFDRTGLSVNHSFSKAGEHIVKLGLVGEPDNKGVTQKTCVYKKITIVEKE